MEEGCKYFTDLCRELFQLEQKYGYSPGQATLRNYECSMMFTKEVGFHMTDAQLRALLEHYAVFLHANWEGLLEDHHMIFAAVQRYRQRRRC